MIVGLSYAALLINGQLKILQNLHLPIDLSFSWQYIYIRLITGEGYCLFLYGELFNEGQLKTNWYIAFTTSFVSCR